MRSTQTSATGCGKGREWLEWGRREARRTSDAAPQRSLVSCSRPIEATHRTHQSQAGGHKCAGRAPAVNVGEAKIQPPGAKSTALLRAAANTLDRWSISGLPEVCCGLHDDDASFPGCETAGCEKALRAGGLECVLWRVRETARGRRWRSPSSRACQRSRRSCHTRPLALQLQPAGLSMAGFSRLALPPG